MITGGAFALLVLRNLELHVHVADDDLVRSGRLVGARPGTVASW